MAERYRSNFRPQVIAEAGSFNPDTIGSREQALKEDSARKDKYSSDFLAQIKENNEVNYVILSVKSSMLNRLVRTLKL